MTDTDLSFFPQFPLDKGVFFIYNGITPSKGENKKRGLRYEKTYQETDRQKSLPSDRQKDSGGQHQAYRYERRYQVVSVTNHIFMIYDEKASACVGTFMSLSDEAARRSFEDLIFNWQPSVYNEHPEDFSLYHLTDFVCDDGAMCSIRVVYDGNFPYCVVRGSEYSRTFIDNERIKRRERFLNIVKTEDVSRET